MSETREDEETIGEELVRVRAQVMIRDDSSGGWIPMGSGGLSSITVNRVQKESEDGEPKQELTIYGKRIPDETVILNCLVREDFEYNKVMPTFHHWRSGHEKFGLTFQTASDGRAFDKGLRGLDPYEKIDADEEEVFLAFAKEPKVEPEVRPPTPEPYIPEYLRPNAEAEDRITFMQLTGLPEYCYPNFHGNKKLGNNTNLKKRNFELSKKPLRTFGMLRKTGRLRCRYCQELFDEEDNKRGACEYAPDCIRATIDELTCIRCARCMLYHCMADAEGDFVQHPCDCKENDNCVPRWVGLGLLSILAPCLLLYPPLKACYWCGVRCGLCGGRHRTAT